MSVLTIDIINPAVIRNIVSTKVKMMICLTESFLMLTFTYSNKDNIVYPLLVFVTLIICQLY